jgi:hypothetical protein
VTNRHVSLVGDLSPAPVDLPRLCDLAARGLVPMLDAERQLFCYRCKLTQNGLVQEGVSHRYTIMAILGLQQHETAGFHSSIDFRMLSNKLIRDTAWINNIGDAGLLLWLCASVSPECLEDLCSRLDLPTALVRYREARIVRTTELAWFLTGLSHALLSSPQQLSSLAALAVTTFRLLKQNQGKQGIFGHLARTRSLAGAIRGNIGSFADQVYPIYALVRFAQACHTDPALKIAQACADAICRVQGPLGQWWWHYDSSTGKVVEKYPVYSVHQDGMAPMALFALADATGLDFDQQIQRGLSWITGQNERHYDLQDASTDLIWRCLYHGEKYKILLSRALGLSGVLEDRVSVEDLKVLFECRPYHLGWLLYAFSGRKVSSTLIQNTSQK